MTIFSPPKFLKTGVMFALTLVRHGETLHNKDNVIQEIPNEVDLTAKTAVAYFKERQTRYPKVTGSVSPGGQLDVPLSTIGLEQAELLGKHLQQQRFTHVYSSDLSRAKQTAQSILEKNQVTPGPIVEDQRLRERKFGTVEGRSFGYLKEASNKANQSVSSYTPPGAETLDQVRKRAVAFFDDLCQLLRGSYPTEDQENLSPSKRKREEQSPSLPSSLSSSPSSFPPPYNSPSSTAPPFADELIRAALSPSADESSVAAAADPAPNVSLSPLIEQWPSAGGNNPPRKLSACSSSDEGDGVGGGALLASVLVVSHGALLREMVRHLVEDLGCCVPGGRNQAMRISPNAGISKFTVSGPREKPRIVCHLIHDRQHLMGGSACPIVSAAEAIPRRREVQTAGLSADATAL